MKEIILDIRNNEILERDYSPEQLREAEEAQAKAAQIRIQAEAKATAKAALLEKLGITEEEAKLLLG